MTIAASAMGTELVKVTIGTPTRWMDVALPENVPVAELLPYVLRHAGDDTPDAGERHGGWLLRRPTGETLDSRKTLGAQQVLDGEVLHLVPGQLEWPELEYDDLVEAIASGARKYGRSWGKAATRRCGLIIGCALLLAGVLVTTSFDPPWLLPGLAVLSFAALLMGLGVLIARAVPDAVAGVVFSGASMVYGFVGATLVTGPGHVGLTGLGAPQLLLGSVVLAGFGLIGYVGVSALSRVFAVAISAGLFGTLGALLAGSMAPDAAAALTLTVAVGALPGYPLVAVRLGRLPLPALPQRASELLEEVEPPEDSTVFAAAARTDELLTGLLTGLAIVSVIATLYLAADGGATRVVMLVALAVALLLRGRLFTVPRQRLPLLTAGIVVGAVLVGMLQARAETNTATVLWLLGVAGAAGIAVYAGLIYSRKNPSPYLGRFADVLDVVAIIALVPLTCYITGFYGYVQGVMAGIG